MSLRMPEPDAALLARRDAVVAALRAIVPGEGVIEERVPGAEVKPRRQRLGRRGRVGEFYYDQDRNRIEVRTRDGKNAGMEMPRGT